MHSQIQQREAIQSDRVPFCGRTRHHPTVQVVVVAAWPDPHRLSDRSGAIVTTPSEGVQDVVVSAAVHNWAFEKQILRPSWLLCRSILLISQPAYRSAWPLAAASEDQGRARRPPHTTGFHYSCQEQRPCHRRPPQEASHEYSATVPPSCSPRDDICHSAHEGSEQHHEQSQAEPNKQRKHSSGLTRRRTQ